jgi:hypothetical protein
MAGLSGVGLYFKQDAGERFGAHVIKRFFSEVLREPGC